MEKADKSLTAACGLFCPSCAIFIASNEDEERLQRQADYLGITKEQTICKGCRSDKRCATCANCVMLKCTIEKGIDFCSECDNYPCNELKNFQSVMPHRVELFKDLDKIKKFGFEVFYKDSIDNYKCNKCNTINPGWDISCRKCGNTPSCNYVANNIDEIKRRIEH